MNTNLMKQNEKIQINKILVVGHQFSGYESVAELLKTGGMSSAKPSKREGMQPDEISTILLKTHGNQSSGQQLSISSVWNGLALDLMLGNIDQSIWCWADSQAVSLLDFWKSLDSKLAFVLVYDTPEQFIARSFSETQILSPDALQMKLHEWIAYNKTLLTFYHNNRDSAFLVHSQQIQKNGIAYLEHVQSQIGIPLLTASYDDNAAIVSQVSVDDSDVDDLLYAYLAKDLLQHYPDVMELYEKLQSEADLPTEPSEFSIISTADVWSSAVRSKMEQLQKLHTISEHANALQNEKQNLEMTLQKNKQANDEQIKESELFLSQLHQVQEELERQYLQSMELKQKTRTTHNSTYEADRIKGHLSYRLGKIMVEARTPMSWLKLPWTLRKAYKDYKQSRNNG